MKIQLVRYLNEIEVAINLIINFWQVHNQYTPTYKEAYDD